MKYSKREIRSFNLFALFMLGLGGLFFTLGVVEIAVQPKIEYTISQAQPKADVARECVGKNAPVIHQKHRLIADDAITVEGINLSAMSNILIGMVFMALSVILDRMLQRVKRHDSEDVKTRQKNIKRK